MISILDTKFQNNDNYLIISGKLEVDPTKIIKIELGEKNYNDVVIISSNKLYQSIQTIIKSYPVKKRNINILDHNNNTICTMSKQRSKNRCGNIPITIGTKYCINEIIIPDKFINEETDYYIDIQDYEPIKNIISDKLKKELLVKDIFKFIEKYSNLKINFICDYLFGTFIKTNFDKLPENINFIHNVNKDLTTQCLCEEIFGKVITRNTCVIQGEFIFTTEEKNLKPKFIFSDNNEIGILLKEDSVQYTGDKSCNFVMALIKESMDPITNITIINNSISKICFSGKITDNWDFKSNNIDNLILNVDLYQSLVEICKKNKDCIKEYILNNCSLLFKVIFDENINENISSEITNPEVNIINRKINYIKRKIKDKMGMITTQNYSLNTNDNVVSNEFRMNTQKLPLTGKEVMQQLPRNISESFGMITHYPTNNSINLINSPQFDSINFTPFNLDENNNY